jgi:hypothetical protein
MLTTATLTGAVTDGQRGWPFSLPLTDLASVGYVAEEFFLDGTAAAYEVAPGAELAMDGKWPVRPSRTAPFRTRVLVVRPVDTARFNGVVHVNWQNVTAGFELGAAVAESEQLLDGFAWVGVSAQRVGVHGVPGTEQFALRGWDPRRYGTLDHPGDDFSFDIYTQAARAIGPVIMGSAEARKLVASGASQSAMRLRTYANAIQPVQGLFDGFFLLLDFGRGALPDTRDIDTATLPMATVPVQDPPRSRRSGSRVQQRDRGALALSGAPARHRHIPVVGGGRNVPPQRRGKPEGVSTAFRTRRHHAST